MLTTIFLAAGAMAQAYGTTAPTSRIQAPAPAAKPAPAAAAAPALPVPPAGIPGRTLKDLPGATISYYDIAGTTMPEIQAALKASLADPANKDAARLYSWDVGTKIQKATTGTTCVTQGATSQLTAKVRLPRLAAATQVTAPVLANWNVYVATNENQAAADLWFLSERLRGAEQALVGMPCDQAGPAWNAKLATVRSELSARVAQRQAAAAAAAAAAAPTAVKKPGG